MEKAKKGQSTKAQETGAKGKGKKEETSQSQVAGKEKAQVKAAKTGKDDKKTQEETKSRSRSKSGDNKKDRKNNKEKPEEKRRGFKKQPSVVAEKEEEEKLKPSRALSAYLFFATKRIPEIKVAEGLTHQEAMKRAGVLWNTATEKDKEPFVKLHQKDQERYERQVADLKSKGYFTLESGEKSTDVEVPRKKKAAGHKSDQVPSKKKKPDGKIKKGLNKSKTSVMEEESD